jgi:hypothetical protein
MISFSVAYLLVLSAVIATLRFFRTGGKLRACYFAALAMNFGNDIAVRSRGEVCPMPYALCPMPYALCQIVPHVTEKGYIMSDRSATIFRSGQVYWISDLYYRQCVNPPLGEFWLIYLTSYHPHKINELDSEGNCK